MIAGLRYVAGYLDEPTHDSLLRAADAHRWQQSVDHRVQIYGYNYRHKDRTAIPIGELPEWSMGLAKRLHRDGFVPVIPNQLVVNDYAPGQGIFEHVDQAVFGEVVISVSLGSTCVMQFAQNAGSGREELLLEPRSALILSGEARTAWKHGIPARLSDEWQGREHVRSRRVSLTFRRI